VKGPFASPVVSVVIPAYNAEATLPETLESALRQTCRDIEVLVIDDGSRDGTRGVAEAYASRDGRVRVLSQPNGGVARARNYGADEARGRVISPLDADDLWHPRKLEEQLKALGRVAGAALAYNWSRFIDEHGVVTGSGPAVRFEGHVFHRHIMWNFIGNGSTPLIVSEVLRQVGYDPALRDSAAQGAEDYLMQMRVAKDYGFACAPAYLTGYRRVSGTMSGDELQMLWSIDRVFESLASESHGLTRRLCHRRRVEFLTWAAEVHLKTGGYRQALIAVLSAARLEPMTRALWLFDRALLLRFRRARHRGAAERLAEAENAGSRVPFDQQDPWGGPTTFTTPPEFARMHGWLAKADASMGRQTSSVLPDLLVFQGLAAAERTGLRRLGQRQPKVVESERFHIQSSRSAADKN